MLFSNLPIECRPTALRSNSYMMGIALPTPKARSVGLLKGRFGATAARIENAFRCLRGLALTHVPGSGPFNVGSADMRPINATQEGVKGVRACEVTMANRDFAIKYIQYISLCLVFNCTSLPCSPKKIEDHNAIVSKVNNNSRLLRIYITRLGDGENNANLRAIKGSALDIATGKLASLFRQEETWRNQMKNGVVATWSDKLGSKTRMWVHHFSMLYPFINGLSVDEDAKRKINFINDADQYLQGNDDGDGLYAWNFQDKDDSDEE